MRSFCDANVEGGRCAEKHVKVSTPLALPLSKYVDSTTLGIVEPEGIKLDEETWACKF